MSQLVECTLKVILLLGVIALLSVVLSGSSAWVNRQRTRVLQGLVVLGVAAYMNFGFFHTDGSPVHLWDQYHYFVGSKYFDELRYDGLYVATLQVRRERHPDFELPARVRDLRSGQLVALTDVADHTNEVRRRFSDDRWQRFGDDVDRFYIQDDILLDNGLKATPAHVQVLRLFTSWQPFRTRSLIAAATLDFILLGLAGFAIYRAFGLEALTSAALILGFGFCSRYYWVGGALLRHDWLAALLIAAALLHRKRFYLAGIAIGYAAVVRIFPLLFVAPLVLYWLAHRREAGTLRDATQFLSAFAITVLAMVGISWAMEPWAWEQSIRGLIMHARIIFPNSVGLRMPLITSFANFRGDLVDPSTLYDYAAITQDYWRVQSDRLWLVALAMAAIVGFAVRAAWRAPTAVAAMTLGSALVFALTAPTCYYLTYFLLLAFVLPLRTALIFSAGSLLCFLTASLVLGLSQLGYMTLNGAAVFGPTSLAMAWIMIEWLRRFPQVHSNSITAATAAERPR